MIPEFSSLFLLTYLLGLIGLFFDLLAPQFKCERKLMMTQILADLCWSSHLILIGMARKYQRSQPQMVAAE